MGGERRTTDQIFLQFGKRNYNRKTITELQTDENEIGKEEDKILEIIEKLYDDLYRSKITVSQVTNSLRILKFQSLIMMKRTNWKGSSL